MPALPGYLCQLGKLPSSLNNRQPSYLVSDPELKIRCFADNVWFVQASGEHEEQVFLLFAVKFFVKSSTTVRTKHQFDLIPRLVLERDTIGRAVGNLQLLTGHEQEVRECTACKLFTLRTVAQSLDNSLSVCKLAEPSHIEHYHIIRHQVYGGGERYG